MFELKSLQNLNAYFDPLSARGGKGVYFYRISGYNPNIDAFIRRYYQSARQTGVVIEGRMPNPDDKNLAYYDEMMGPAFQVNPSFFANSLQKWLPRMEKIQREHVSLAMYDILDTMRKEGKNENILKNAYIKFMCWLYYKLERIAAQLGGEQPPKILCEGAVGSYELRLLAIVSRAGCDIVLLDYDKGVSYQKADPQALYSKEFQDAQAGSFPTDFSLAQLRSLAEQEAREQRLFGPAPTLTACTNAWIRGEALADILTPPQTRGTDDKLFYNCLIRMHGVQDKLTYANELYQFHLQMTASKRKMVVVEGQIPPPTPEEISAIRRKNYADLDQMLLDLSTNITHSANLELQRLMLRAFDAVMRQDAAQGGSLNKRMNHAVYLLAWLKRYQNSLFAAWSAASISCFVHLGGCQNESEALFLRFLSQLPVDVLLLVPSLSSTCCFADTRLFEKRYDETLSLPHFPTENAAITMGTAAFHAERELDTLLYQDSGFYRNQQYQRAVAVSLQTTYEEIALLWDQDLKYRPNFSVVDDTVSVPAIFAKASGVKDGQTSAYWSAIKALITEETLLISNPPYYKSSEANPQKAFATEFIKNGKLLKEKIKSHRAYPYGFLREEMQAHILDKLQLLLEQRLIRGCFENGTEYTIIATILNMPKEILRLLQGFDFTKKNPKLIYINTLEQAIPLDDAILTAFLNLIGFDLLFFVPTGYQTVELLYTKKLMQEHQLGTYLYDLPLPNFPSISGGTRPSWRERLFGKG